jgi:hypothetical protein
LVFLILEQQGKSFMLKLGSQAHIGSRYINCLPLESNISFAISFSITL